MDKLALHKAICEVGAEWDRRQNEKIAKRRIDLSEQGGQLELARSIQPARVRKGSVLDQFTATNADDEFGSVTPMKLAAAGPGSADGWRHLMQAQYPTIAAMHDVHRPSFTAEPSHWNTPVSSATLEARFGEALRGLDPGPAESIPAALGFPDLKATFSAMAKMKSPALKAVCDSCKAFGDLMADVHKAHHDNVTSLNKAHSATIDGAHSVQAARTLHKAHTERMVGVHSAHLDTVGRMHERFGKIVTDALAKIDAQGQYHGESIAEPAVAPDFVN